MNIFYGLFPWRIFLLPEGKQFRGLFGCSKRTQEWFWIQTSNVFECDDWHLADEDIVKNLEDVVCKYKHIFRWAHIEIGKTTRFVCFET